MKFGKRMLREMFAPWRDFYLNYKQLKKVLGRIIDDDSSSGHSGEHPDLATAPDPATLPSTGEQTDARQQSATPAGDEQLFLHVLETELAKVNLFFTTLERECTDEFEHLSAALANPSERRDAVIKQLLLFCEKLNLARQYVVLNYMACTKIVKKRNKKFKTPGSGSMQILPILLEQYFYSSPVLGKLLVHAQILLIQVTHSPLEESHFLCPVCVELICAPIIFSCGHVLCFDCFSLLSTTAISCPVCRRVQTVPRSSFSIDGPLSAFLSSSFPSHPRQAQASNPTAGSTSGAAAAAYFPPETQRAEPDRPLLDDGRYQRLFSEIEVIFVLKTQQVVRAMLREDQSQQFLLKKIEVLLSPRELSGSVFEIKNPAVEEARLLSRLDSPYFPAFYTAWLENGPSLPGINWTASNEKFLSLFSAPEPAPQPPVAEKPRLLQRTNSSSKLLTIGGKAAASGSSSATPALPGASQSHAIAIQTETVQESSTGAAPFTLFVQLGVFFDTTLHQLIRAPSRALETSQCANMFHQVLTALSYLHSLNVTHGDVTAQSISVSSSHQIKFCRFESMRSHSSSLDPSFRSLASVDVLCAAILLSELLSPFSSEVHQSLVRNDARCGRFSESFLEAHPEAAEVMLNIVKTRPTAQSVLASPALRLFCVPDPATSRKRKAQEMSGFRDDRPSTRTAPLGPSDVDPTSRSNPGDGGLRPDSLQGA
eukprot:TRINITY_DN6392_c0_g1_i1.p1 TRINITY_DN6392_c0_g1~~TRINITY_DN6392_c0_g1_i1.p1  ORF type:complete len:711 (-),score=134.42 TRINITY_DN6392_c0_g1_i1:45-2177(-)